MHWVTRVPFARPRTPPRARGRAPGYPYRSAGKRLTNSSASAALEVMPSQQRRRACCWTGSRSVGALDRTVFIAAQAPREALAYSGITTIVVGAAGIPGPVHARRLRHSAASAMLRGGGSLTEIGQALRHARPATTAIYAKADIGALRPLGRPSLARPGGNRMTADGRPLRDSLEDHLALRRALGFRLKTAGRLLDQFVSGLSWFRISSGRLQRLYRGRARTALRGRRAQRQGTPLPPGPGELLRRSSPCRARWRTGSPLPRTAPASGSCPTAPWTNCRSRPRPGSAGSPGWT